MNRLENRRKTSHETSFFKKLKKTIKKNEVSKKAVKNKRLTKKRVDINALLDEEIKVLNLLKLKLLENLFLMNMVIQIPVEHLC